MKPLLFGKRKLADLFEQIMKCRPWNISSALQRVFNGRIELYSISRRNMKGRRQVRLCVPDDERFQH